MRTKLFLSVVVGVLCVVVEGIEHNLPEGVELVDPKDLGLDSQIDLDKLLGNVKALPIDGNALSSAIGKPGLKTQVLTVGFDGSEGINLDDFELPQLKNDEHAPLAQAAFSSFRNFFRNNSTATRVGGQQQVQQVQQFLQQSQPQEQEPIRVTTHRPGGKRKMMRRRKIVKVNNGTSPTTTSTTTPASTGGNRAGPKVIELDSSQIEKLIASGKIGPPKSLTPGGPQIIELGQKDLDALLSSENGDEIKQILEGGDSVKDFDLSQLSSSNSAPVTSSLPLTTSSVPRVTESVPPVSNAQLFQTSTVPQEPQIEVISTPPPQQQQETGPTTQEAPPTSTPPPSLVLQDQNQNLPIIYQYNTAQDQQQGQQPQQPFQSSVPLQYYETQANGQQQARLVKHPTFELISAPPVSFSSSVLPHINGNNVIPVFPPQVPQILLQPQQQQQFEQQNQQQQFEQQIQQQQFEKQIQQQQQQQQQQQIQQIQQQQQQQQQIQQIQQQQQQQQFRNTFISPQSSSNFIPAGAPPSSPSKDDSSLNKILPAKQQSAHTEQVKPASSSSSLSTSSAQNNYLQTIHKVNLPLNSVKLVTPSPQIVHSILNSVPASFQPSLAPNHVVSSPVVDPLRVNGQHHQSTFLGGPSSSSSSEPFRNTQLFNAAPASSSRQPIRSSPQNFRFPSTSSIFSSGGPNRFRTSESSNPYFNLPPAVSGTRFAGSSPNLVLNSFVAGDGLNYRPRSAQDFRAPGI